MIKKSIFLVHKNSIQMVITLGIGLMLLILLVASCAQQLTERSGAITLDGEPLTLRGPELKVGEKAPDFALIAPFDYVESIFETKEVTLSENSGKVRLISVVPSLDTPVCDMQARRFEETATKYSDVVFYTISMDLPFAQARYCGAENIEELVVLSDYRNASFGLDYGVLIKELHLLSRAIFIVDRDDTIKYVEYVNEISLPPDYDNAFQALQALVGSPSSPVAATGLEVGDLAPDFTLNNLDGQSVSLSDFKGKPVLLNFWATWCPHCREERPLIQEIHEDWLERGLVVLTVDLIGTGSNETPANLSQFMQVNNYSFPVLLDVDGEALRTFNITATPTNFLIDADGIIQGKVVSPFSSKAQLEGSLNNLISRS